MKINNKGFAISTALYGLLSVLIIVLMLILQIARTTNTNNRDIASNIQKKLSVCEPYKEKYNKCINNCDKWFNLSSLCFEYSEQFQNVLKNDKQLIDDYINTPTEANLEYLIAGLNE